MLNKITKEMKKNKYTVGVFLIFLLVFLLGWIAYSFIMPSAGKPAYGNRLDGIEEVAITSKEENSIIEDLKNEKVVTNAKIHMSGKIINVLVEVQKGTKTSTAKNLHKHITSNLTKEQKEFYDIQIFITNENDDAKGYPLIGYKSATASNFTF